jgi:hypothetical protein
MSADTNLLCMKYGPKEWHCSLQKGHIGNHEAYEGHDTSSDLLDSWSQITMNPADAERLEWLELDAKNEGAEFELLLEKSAVLCGEIEASRQRLRKKVQLRDDFKSALQGMGCETK